MFRWMARRSKPGSDEVGEDELPSHRAASTPTGKPRPEAQRNFTDLARKRTRKGEQARVAAGMGTGTGTGTRSGAGWRYPPTPNP